MPEGVEKSGTPVSSTTEKTAFAGGPNSPVEPEVPKVEEPKSEPQSKVYDETYVKQLRDEAAKHRTEKQAERERIKKLEEKLKAFEDAQLTEEEKRNKEFETTKSALNKALQKAAETDLKYQLAVAAQSAKITDLKAAIKLADRELMEVDDNGVITNMEDVISDLRENYPSVFSAPQAPNSSSTNPTKQSSAKKYTKEDIIKLRYTNPDRVTELLEAGELNHLL